MKITRWYKRIGAALLSAGLLAPCQAQALEIPLGDPSFEDFVIPAEAPVANQFAYARWSGAYQYRPTSAWIGRPGAGGHQDSIGAGGSNWIYTAAYAEGGAFGSFRGSPRTGNQAMHGRGHVSGQVVDAVFEVGKIYTFSIYAQGDHDAELILDPAFGWQSRVYLLIYDGDLYGNDVSFPGDHHEVVREIALTYDEEENNPLSPEFTYFPHDRFAPPEPIPPDGTMMTAGDFVNRDPSWTAAQSRAAWQQISVSHKVMPGAPEVGHHIGVAFKLFDDSAVDDASLSVIDRLADLNNDMVIDAADWMLQRDNMHTNLSALTPEERYAHGDLNGDGFNNYQDFVAFANSYDAANGAGALASLMAVPEPAAGLLTAAAGFVLLVSRRSK